MPYFIVQEGPAREGTPLIFMHHGQQLANHQEPRPWPSVRKGHIKGQINGRGREKRRAPTSIRKGKRKGV